MEKVTLNIKGMHCGICVNTVDKALRQIPGVNASSVSLERGHATINYNPSLVGVSDLIQAVTKVSYSAEIPGNPDPIQSNRANGDVITGARKGGCCS